MTQPDTSIRQDNFQLILDTLTGLLPEVPKGHWIGDYLDYESFKDQLMRDRDFFNVDFSEPIDEPVRYDIALAIKKKLMGNEFINQCQQIVGRM